MEHASPSLQIASAAVSLASKLKGDALGERVDLKSVSGFLTSLPEDFKDNERVRQLQAMVEMARRIGGAE